jgi:hypothetical protein
MEPRRGQSHAPAFDQAAFGKWLSSRQGSRGGALQQQQQQQPAGLGHAGLPDQLGLGSGYLGLDPGLPPAAGCAPPPFQHYPHLETSATERQLSDLFSHQLDLLNLPALAHIDPYHAGFPDEPLFGPAMEEKPRSKMQEKNRRVRRTDLV